MSVRQRKQILETLKEHFVVYNLPRNITLDAYLKIVHEPILRRAIKKNFYNWPRIVRALFITYPELATRDLNAVEPVEPVDPIDPLEALKASKSNVA